MKKTIQNLILLLSALLCSCKRAEVAIEEPPLLEAFYSEPTLVGETNIQKDLYKGFDMKIYLNFSEEYKQTWLKYFVFKRIDVSVPNFGNFFFVDATDGDSYNLSNNVLFISFHSSYTLNNINNGINEFYELTDSDAFVADNLEKLFYFELYYDMN